MSDLFDTLADTPVEPSTPRDLFDELASDAPPAPVASTQLEPDPLGGREPKTPYEKLAKTLQDHQLYGSATTAFSEAWNKDIGRRKDGHWDLPALTKGDGGFLDSAAGVVTTVAQKLGQRIDDSGPMFDETPIQAVFHKFQQDNNLSDEEVGRAWSDLGNVSRPMEADEEGRVLSNGTFLPNVRHKAFSSEQGALDALKRSNASPAFKLAMEPRIPEMVREVARNKLESYSAAAAAIESPNPLLGDALAGGGVSKWMTPEMIAPDVWAIQNNRMGDFGTPKFIEDYEKAQVDTGAYTKLTQGIRGAMAKGNIDLASQLSGAAGLASIDAATAASGELSAASRQVKEGNQDLGLFSSVLEQVAPLGVQIAVTRGVGMLAGAATTSATAVQTAATLGAVVTAGLQSAGAQMGQGIEQGLSEEDARSKAVKAGISTAVITGLFQTMGLGGVEKIAAGGSVGDITLRQVLASSGAKEISSNVRRFAGDVLKASLGEATEEGMDQLSQAFLTANPDTNLADAWNNAEEAFGIGGVLGGLVHVGAQAITSQGDLATPMAVVTKQAAANAAAAGLPQTAAVVSVGIQAPQTPQPSPSAPMAGGVMKVTAGKNSQDVSVAEQSGVGLASRFFGDAPKGETYSPDLDPEQFDLVPIKGTNLLSVRYEGLHTDRAYNPATGTSEALPEAVAGSYKAMQEGTLRSGERFLVAAPKTEVASTQEAEPADDIDTTPTPKTNVTNPQGQSGPEVHKAPQVQVSSVPTGTQAQPNPVPAGELPAAAAPAQAQAETEVVPLDDSAIGKLTREVSIPVSDASKNRPLHLANVKALLKELHSNPQMDARIRDEGFTAVRRAEDHMTPEDRQQVSDYEFELEFHPAVIPDSSTRNNTAFSSPKADLDKTIQKGVKDKKVTEHVDSGPAENGHPTLDQDLPLNAVLTSTDEGGNPVDQRRVMWTEALPNGGVRHHLQRIEAGEASTQAAIGRYQPNAKVLTASKGMTMAIKSASTHNGTLVHPEARKALLEATRFTVREQLAAITSPEFADSRLVFGSDIPRVLMFQHNMDGQSRIHVSEDTLLDQFIERTAGIPLDNTVALQGAAQDFTQFLAQTVFHELKHELFEQHVPREQAVQGMREMVELASLPGVLRDTLLHNARQQMEHGFIADAELANLSDEELMEALSGNNPKLGEAALEEALYSLAHEVVVNLSEQMETGTSYEETLSNLNSWAQRFVNPDATPKQLTRLQSLMNRLMEMANRLASAVSNFYAAHRLAGQLPPSLYDASLALQAAMEAGPFRAPDVYNIQARAMAEANDRLNRVTESSRKFREGDLVAAQRSLREAVRLANARGVANPVSLDPITGLLKTNEDTLKPLVDRVNSAGNGETIVMAAQMARDLSLALKHLNAGRAIGPNSKVTDTFDPERVDENSGFIRESVRRSVEQASGMTESVLVSQLNTAQAQRYMDLYEGLGPAFNDLNTLFTEGALSRYPGGRKAAEAVRAAEVAQADASAAHSLDANPDTWKALKAADEQLFTSRGALTQLVNDLVSHSTNPKDPLYDAALLMKDAVDSNRRAMARALERYEGSKVLTRPISSISDALALNARHPDVMDQILMTANLNDGRVKSALVEGQETLSAIGRLRTFPAQLEYLAMGGVRPTSITRPDAVGWQSMNATLDGSRRLLPLSAGRALRSGVGGLEGMQGVVDRSFNSSAFPGEVEIPGTATFTYPGNVDIEGIDPELARNFLAGEELTLTTANGVLDASNVLYRPLLENLASAVHAAATETSALLGLPFDYQDNPLQGFDLNERTTENARALNAPLVNALIDEHWRFGVGVTEQVMVTGGFPVPMETREDGTTRMRFPDTLIRLPDTGNNLGERKLNDLIESGAMGDLLASTHVATKLLEAEPSGTHTEVMLSHAQGLTPAGLAYQLVSAKWLEFTALSKGLVVTDKVSGVKTDIQEAIISASSNPELTREAFESLAPDFENSRAFLTEKAALAANPYNLGGRFWDLYKMARAANTIYSDTQATLHDKASLRAALPQQGDERLPISRQEMSNVGFQQGLRRKLANPKGHIAPARTFISLMTPVSARKLQERLLNAIQEHDPFVGKDTGADSGMRPSGRAGFGVDQIGPPTKLELEARREAAKNNNSVKPSFMQRTGDDARNRDGRKDVAENVELAMWRSEQEAEQAREFLDKTRYQVLAALFGGHQETIMGFVHSPEFASVATNERGEKVLSYHTDKLNARLLEELEKLRSEEIQRGIVMDHQGNSFDHFLDHEPVFAEDGSIQDPGGLRQRNSGFDDVIESLGESGGEVSREFHPGLVNPSQAPSFDATPSSVMSSLIDRISGVVIITGNAFWQGSQDTTGAFKTKPTVVFIPDASAPTLIFLYGENVEVDENDARRAVTSMLSWMGRHGGLDLQAEARNVLAPVRARGDDGMSSKLQAKFRDQLEEILADSGQPLTEVSDAIIHAYATLWTRHIDKAADKALLRLNSPLSLLFDRKNTSTRITEDQAAEVLSLALTHNSAKRILLLSMAEDPELPYPLPWAVLAHGNLASTGAIPGALDHFQAAQIAALPTGLVMTDERGVTVNPDSPEDFIAAAQQEAFKGLDAMFAQAGITPQQATELGASPLMHQQMQWLNNLLYDVMGRLHPEGVAATGLAGTAPAQQGLTQMESRQLMAMMDPELLADAVRAATGTTQSARWNQPERGSALSIDAMMRVSGEVADKLRAQYNAWSPLDGPTLVSSSDFVQRQARNVGTFSLTDFGRDDTWHQTRIRKGMVRYGQLYGAEMMKVPDHNFYTGTLDADPRELERRAIDGGFVQHTDILNPDGTRERVTIHEAEIREFNRQKERDQQILSRVQQEALERGFALTAAQAAQTAFEAASDTLEAAQTADEFLAGMSRITDVSGSAEETSQVVRKFFQDRHELVRSMASSVVSDFREYQDDIARTVNLGQVANGRSQMEYALTQLSVEHRAAMLESGQFVINGHLTLERLESNLNPTGRISGEGVPRWYVDLPKLDRQRLLMTRRTINQATEQYNDRVAQVAHGGNRHVPGLLEGRDHVLPYLASPALRGSRETFSRSQMTARVAAMQELLSDVRDPRALASRVQDAAIRHAVDRSKWYNPSDGVSSLDLSQLANGDTRIQIPEQAAAELNERLRQRMSRQEQESAVVEILSRHVFTREELMNDAKLAVQDVLSRSLEQAAQQSNQANVESMVLRAARGVSELTRVDSLTATRLVLDTITKVTQGQVAASQLAVESALRFQAETEAALLKNQNSVGASKADPENPSESTPMVINFKGTPDNIAINRRILARDGEVWSRLQQGQIGRSAFRDGWDDAHQADMTADELAEQGAAALSSATRTPYSVTGDLLVPDDIQIRVRGLLAQQDEKEPTEAQVRARVAEMKWSDSPLVDLLRQSRRETGKPREVTETEFEALKADQLQTLRRAASILEKADSGTFKMSDRQFSSLVEEFDDLLGPLAPPVTSGGGSGFVEMDDQAKVAWRQEYRANLQNALRDANAEIELLKVLDFQKPVPRSLRHAATIPSSPPAHPEVDRIMKRLDGSKLFAAPAHLSAAAQAIETRLGRYGAMATARYFHEDMVSLLVEEKNAKALVSKGAVVDSSGVRGPDLHSRVVQSLNLLHKDPSDANVANAFQVYGDVVAFLTADKHLDDLIAGFVGTKALTGTVRKGLMHHNSKVRKMFARSFLSQKAARRIVAIIEHGPNGNLGRNRAKAMTNAYAKLSQEEINKLGGGRLTRAGKKVAGQDNRLELASAGWLNASVKSALESGYGSDSDRAKALLKMFDQAKDGLLVALNQGGNSTIPGAGIIGKLHAFGMEETARHLEERELFRSLRDGTKHKDGSVDRPGIVPVLEQIASGSITKEDGIVLMEANLKGWDERSYNYGRFLEGMFASASTGMMGSQRLMGGDAASTQRKPVVPFRWNTFNRELSESQELSETSTLASIERSVWGKPANRQFAGKEINLLNINGSTAPMSIVSDMLLRMNVAPSYQIANKITGSGETVGKRQSQVLRYESGEPGLLGRMALERFGNGDTLKQANAASIAVALMNQEIVENEFTSIAPNNRLMRAAHELSLKGSMRALNSSSNLPRQSLPALLFYACARNGFLGNKEIFSIYALYNASKAGEVPGRIASRLKGQEHLRGKNFGLLVDEFIEERGAHIFARQPGGNENFLEDVSRDRPALGMTPKGRITGKGAKHLRALALPFTTLHEWETRGGTWMLKKNIGSAEKSVNRPVFMNEVLRGMNQHLVSQGYPAITMPELLTDRSLQIPPGVLQDAGVIVDDMFGPSESSKKGAWFQPSDSVFFEVARQLWTTFANHQVSLSANTDAAASMLRHGDAETRAEARRIIVTNLGQNITFQLLRPGLLVALAALAASGWGDDEGKYERIQRFFFGMNEGDGLEGRNLSAMYWATMLLGGEDAPMGYDKLSDSFTDQELRDDAKLAALRVSKEFAMQTPLGGLGMLASTALGSQATEAALKLTLMEALPGNLKEYDRAGFVRPEWLGGDDEGPRSESGLSKLMYAGTRLFHNHMEDKGVFMNGAGAVLDPLTLLSQARDEVQFGDILEIIAAQSSFLPREIRKKLTADVKDEVDAAQWHTTWKRQ